LLFARKSTLPRGFRIRRQSPEYDIAKLGASFPERGCAGEAVWKTAQF
jgi:hypothetical protein